jgi:hypothetical protein
MLEHLLDLSYAKGTLAGAFELSIFLQWESKPRTDILLPYCPPEGRPPARALLRVHTP